MTHPASVQPPRLPVVHHPSYILLISGLDVSSRSLPSSSSTSYISPWCCVTKVLSPGLCAAMPPPAVCGYQPGQRGIHKSSFTIAAFKVAQRDTSRFPLSPRESVFVAVAHPIFSLPSRPAHSVLVLSHSCRPQPDVVLAGPARPASKPHRPGVTPKKHCVTSVLYSKPGICCSIGLPGSWVSL